MLLCQFLVRGGVSRQNKIVRGGVILPRQKVRGGYFFLEKHPFSTPPPYVINASPLTWRHRKWDMEVIYSGQVFVLPGTLKRVVWYFEEGGQVFVLPGTVVLINFLLSKHIYVIELELRCISSVIV